jgi:hypothetical protein
VQAARDGDRIEVRAGTYAGDVDVFDVTLEIVGLDGSAATTLTGGTGSGLFYVQGGSVTIRGFTLSSTTTRAMMVVPGEEPANVTLDDVVFAASSVPPDDDKYPMGAALYVDGSLADLHAVTFRDGTAANGRWGGQIGVRGGQITADGLVVEGGASPNGGAIYLEDTLASFTASIVANGQASGDVQEGGTDASSGGGLYVVDSHLDLVDTEITDCAAAFGGGGLYATGSGSVITVRGGSFARDSADFGGGLLCQDNALCELADVAFVDDEAALQGGAFGAFSARVDLVGCSIVRGTAAIGGGGSYSDGQGTLANDLFCGNAARVWGGAISAEGGSAVDSANDDFVWNSADQDGAALGSDGSTVTAVNGLFLGQRALAGEALVRLGAGQLDATYALTWDNGVDAVFELPSSLVEVDPELPGLVDGDCDASDFAPRLGSPLVDAGDPAILDRDGSRSDIGRYGGPKADDAFWADGDDDGSVDGFDCAPTDPATFPGAPELCNGLDDDCDGVVDEDLPDCGAFPRAPTAGGDAPVGCACQGSSGGGWLAALLALVWPRRLASSARTSRAGGSSPERC